MAINEKFLIIKDKDAKEIKYFDYDKIEGYNLKAKQGTNAQFIDAVNISRMIIINPSFAEKIATKMVNSKFEKLINMMNIVCEFEDNDETGEGYKIALNEASKLKRELINKYRKYIQEEKLELMIKKIEILEGEMKLRLEVLSESLEKEKEEEKKGRSR